MKNRLLLSLCVALSAAALAQGPAGIASPYPPETYGTMMPVMMPDRLPALPEASPETPADYWSDSYVAPQGAAEYGGG